MTDRATTPVQASVLKQNLQKNPFINTDTMLDRQVNCMHVATMSCFLSDNVHYNSVNAIDRSVGVMNS